MTNAYIK